MSDFAFVKRELCGCVSAIVVEDMDTLHYVDTLARWKRKNATIMRMTVKQGRAELSDTLQFHPKGHRGRKAWKVCLRVSREGPHD